MKQLKIKTKMVLLITGAELLTVLMLLLIIFFVFIEKFEVDAKDHLAHEADIVLHHIETLINEITTDIKILTLSSGRNIISSDSSIEEKIAFLREFEQAHKIYISSSIYDMKGIRIGDTRSIGIGNNESDTTYFRQAASGSVFIDQKPGFSQTLSISVMQVSGPIYDYKGNITGVLVLRVPINVISSKINKIITRVDSEYLHESIITLVNKKGEVIHTNNKEEESYENSSILRELSTTSNKWITLTDKRHGYPEIYMGAKSDDNPDSPGIGWMMIIEIPTMILYNNIRQLTAWLIIGAAGLFIIILLITLYLSRRLTEPIAELESASKKITGGNLDVKIKTLSNDELGSLARSFNAMTARLRIAKKHESEHNEIMKSQIAEKTAELRKSVMKLDKMNRQLRTSNRAKTDFLDMISHELKTPLTPILTHIDLLKDRDLGRVNKRQSESLSLISRNVDNLKTLIINLLETARIDAGRIQLDLQKTDINNIINEAVKNVDAIAKNKGLKLLTQLHKAPLIIADPNRIKECTENYVRNAVKFTDSGSITIKTEQTKDRLIVRVTDTGLGIQKDKLPHLFKKFYQTNNSKVGRVQGVGLGLYSVKKIIQLHKGEVGADSEYGKGSTFWFALPVKQR